MKFGYRRTTFGMRGRMSTRKAEDPKWFDAREIWAAANVEIPEERNADNSHLLSDLKLAAGMFAEAKRVTAADHARTWSLDDGARICRQLSEFLYQLDDVVFTRMARASKVPVEPLVAQTLANLAQLESALENAPKPPKVRKRKHDIDDFLIIRLADIFMRKTGRRPSVTTDWASSGRGGTFVSFVTEFVARLLPEHAEQIDGRVIQRALKRGKSWGDRDLLDC